MHCCSYCGMPGHKRPTCPKLHAARLAKTTVGPDVPAPAGSGAPEKETKRKRLLTAWDTAEVVMPHCDRTLLYGPPGTGKTTAANYSGSPMAVYNVTLTEEMPAAELRGHFVPKGGEFVWHDGPAMQAYRNGGRLVLNEIDRGSSDALIFCYALLDDPGISKISLPNGEHVLPHPDFTVVATMNGEPEDLPEALQDRFRVRLLIDKPHPDAMKSLPDDLRAAAKNSVSGSGDSRVSFRSWKSFADLRDAIDEEVAARAVFGPRAQSILDTLKLSRATLHTPAVEEDEDETPFGVPPRAPGEFRIGDVVRRTDATGKLEEFTVRQLETVSGKPTLRGPSTGPDGRELHRWAADCELIAAA